MIKFKDVSYKNNPIAVAVEPLKVDAVKHADEQAKLNVAYIKKELEAADWDMKKVAPYPNNISVGTNYFSALAKYNLCSLITSRSSRPTDGRAMYVDIDQNGVKRFYEQTRKDAAEYELFVMKLVGKIGDVQSATLYGNHIWGFSLLTVVLPSGEKQVWETHTITNVSKFGKMFNQFPSRKVKDKAIKSL